MPRIPTVGTQTGRIGFQPVQPAGDGIFEGVSRLTLAGAQIAEQSNKAKNILEEAKRKDGLILLNSEYNRSLSDLQVAAATPEEFVTQAEKMAEKFVGNISDPVTAQRFRLKTVQSIDSINATLVKQAGVRQRSAAIDYMVNSAVPNMAESAARARNSGNDVEYERITSDMLEMIGSSDHFLPEGRAALVADFFETEQTESVQILLAEARENPQDAQAFIDRASAMLDDEITPDIGTKQRLMLRKEVASTTTATIEKSSAQLSLARDELRDGLWERLSDGDPTNIPGELEISTSILSDSEKKYFIGASERKSRGVDPITNISAVGAVVLDGVYNPNSTDPITSVDELAGFLPQGLGRDIFNSAKSHLQGKARAEDKEFEDRLGEFQFSVRPSIVQVGLIPFSDVDGMEKFNDFNIASRKKATELREQGVSLEDMFSSDGEKSLSKMVPGFQRSVKEKVERSTNILRIGSPRNPFIEEAPKSKIPSRNPGETIAEWQKRALGGDQ